eukprot:GDKJ01004465.1.p1 GENE.GDKJ01004465.1~~GDKJ01004465.1.p1  ORF type:complete len:154 (-),score=35.28 GDKJ01004465.1:70-501(-)
MTHSADLQWLIVRQSSKYLQKRGGLRLSNGPLNNSGKWTKRHAGFLAANAAVVKIKGEKQISVTTKKDGKISTQVFPAGVKASEVAKAVGVVRADLTDIAYRRARKMASIIKRTGKVRAARKERSSKLTFKHKAVRAKKTQKK